MANTKKNYYEPISEREYQSEVRIGIATHNSIQLRLYAITLCLLLGVFVVIANSFFGTFWYSSYSLANGQSLNMEFGLLSVKGSVSCTQTEDEAFNIFCHSILSHLFDSFTQLKLFLCNFNFQTSSQTEILNPHMNAISDLCATMTSLDMASFITLCIFCISSLLCGIVLLLISTILMKSNFSGEKVIWTSIVIIVLLNFVAASAACITYFFIAPPLLKELFQGFTQNNAGSQFILANKNSKFGINFYFALMITAYFLAVNVFCINSFVFVNKIQKALKISSSFQQNNNSDVTKNYGFNPDMCLANYYAKYRQCPISQDEKNKLIHVHYIHG